jgi:YegS/Rv2252/BmrU family lipid kinase
MPSSAPPGHFALILNPGSGAGSADQLSERVTSAFQAGGREVRITLAHSGTEISDAVREAIAERAATVVAGGGDGTVSAVAAGLLGHSLPLGVLPLGTLNHFARDLGVPLELEQAVQVILAGHTTPIDVGEVNGHTFLNNASLGLYPHIVLARRKHRARGMWKWFVAFWITLKVLARHRSMAVRLSVGDEVAIRRTAIVFVGNNEYRAAGLDAGSRESLSDGTLAIYLVNAGGRSHPLRLIRLAWHMVLGVALDGDHLELVRAPAVTVESKRSRLYIALDGEVDVYRVPLEFRSLPGALQVLVPAQEPRR